MTTSDAPKLALSADANLPILREQHIRWADRGTLTALRARAFVDSHGAGFGMLAMWYNHLGNLLFCGGGKACQMGAASYNLID